MKEIISIQKFKIEIVTTMQVPQRLVICSTSALDRFSVGTEIFFTVNVRKRPPDPVSWILADGEVVDSTNEPILSIGDLQYTQGLLLQAEVRIFFFLP